MLFGEFYAGVEFDLRQRSEYLTGDESDDLAKPLPSGAARRITNEAIIALLRRLPASRVTTEFTHTVTSSTNKIDLSEYIVTLAAVKVNGNWQYFDNAFTKSTSGIRVVGDNTINKDSGWVAGDTIEMLAITTPDEILALTDPVNFPSTFIELLRKEVVMQAASIVNIELSQLYLMRYTDLLSEYVSSQRIRTNARIGGARQGNVRNTGKR